MKKLALRFYWHLTRMYLRSRGAKVGKNVRCNGFPYVKVRAGGTLIIEDDVMINARPWANAHVIAGSMNLFGAAGASLRLMRGVGVSGTRIVTMQSIEIGQKTLIGGGCLICDSDMHEIPLGSGKPTRHAPIRIGEGVFIAANSIILKGVEIAAGSTVTKPVAPHSLAAGNPARAIRSYSS